MARFSRLVVYNLYIATKEVLPAGSSPRHNTKQYNNDKHRCEMPCYTCIGSVVTMVNVFVTATHVMVIDKTLLHFGFVQDITIHFGFVHFSAESCNSYEFDFDNKFFLSFLCRQLLLL